MYENSSKALEYEEQRCLGLFLQDLRRHREKLLKNTATQAHPQRTITTFFSPITPTNATSQSRDTQMGPRLGHNKGVTIDRAVAICRAHRPRPHGPGPQHARTEISDVDKLVKIYMVGSSTTCITAFREKSLFE